MSKRWINTKVEFIWDGSKYVETSAEGYWYEGEIAFLESTDIGSDSTSGASYLQIIGGIDVYPNTVHSYINFRNANFGDASQIKGITDGSGGSKGGALSFYTTTGGTSGGTERMRISGAGNVGIGTSQSSSAFPAANGLHIASSTSDAQCLVLQQTTDSDGQSANIAFYDYGGTNVAMIRGANISQASNHGALKFYTNAGSGNAERAIIDKDGNVGIGAAAPGYKLEVAGTFYSAGSSVDYKKHVTDLEVDSSLIHSLRPVSYNYKKEYENFGYDVVDGKQIGLVSEEVAKTIPELAIMKDGKPKNVDYQKLAVVLLAEVQNLKKDIEELKKDN